MSRRLTLIVNGMRWQVCPQLGSSVLSKKSIPSYRYPSICTYWLNSSVASMSRARGGIYAGRAEDVGPLHAIDRACIASVNRRHSRTVGFCAYQADA